AKPGAELAAPRDVQHHVAGSEILLEAQRQRLAFGIGADGRLQRAILDARAGAGDVEADAVEMDLAPRRLQANLQLHAALEGRFLQVGSEVSAVAQGLAVGGEPEILAE